MIFASGVGDEGGSSLPLTLTLSPRAGRGDEYDAAASPLRPACGEKVAGRPDEGGCWRLSFRSQ
ncbi:hypothetical protein CN138_02330 [Sinorhizobium meliloti]|nr:hypothetical protein C7U62_04895 [Mesorhizobium loti]RMI07196.1 hypothetical protein DA101_013965 [Sinorhizobium meliloti]RVE92797.1 hypothetical protein CN238_02855 [Sinorhizobium meliloti]RVG56671.1 hypothetical protein CN226_02370 [Sinorhizobium meliloti]RVG70052.1 hypothetical protein CN222_03740 [Sinorhizobium meliloti]